jgi:hypothetical protein
MNRLLAKILLAMLMFPLTFVLFICVFALLEPKSDEFVALGGSCLVAAAFAVGYWLILWRDTVQWTGGRKQRTLAAGCVGAFAGLAIYGLMVSIIPFDGRYVGIVLGGCVGVLFWLTATVLIWRETAAERTERLRQQGRGTVACVRCGYNMTGLREPRCPECGTTYTLDQLLTAQQMDQPEAALAEQDPSLRAE